MPTLTITTQQWKPRYRLNLVAGRSKVYLVSSMQFWYDSSKSHVSIPYRLGEKCDRKKVR